MAIVDVLIYIKEIHCQYNSMKFVKFDNSITPRGFRFSSLYIFLILKNI